MIRDLRNGNKKAGNIIVRVEKEEKNQKNVVTMKLGASGLPDMKWWWFFGGTNSFYRIFRKRNQDELLVYESENIASLNPSWV